MAEIIARRLAAAASLSVIAGLLAACSPAPSGPAPVYIGGTGPTAATAPLGKTAGRPTPRNTNATLPSIAKGPIPKQPPPRTAKSTSDVIPLDASPSRPLTTVEPSPPASTPAPSPTLGISSGRFPWPVHGRLIAG